MLLLAHVDGLHGGDNFVEQTSFVFVDIDRIEKKDQSADNEDLENADIIANKIITKMNKYKFAENYIKICSGNGAQLLFRLDEPITMPTQKFDMSTKEYIEDEQFEKYKVLITETIGEEIKRFINTTTNKRKYGMEVDKSGFQIARVCALPFTKNFKYKSFTWRGIIELKDGKNDGLSDFIIEKEAYVNVQKYVKTNYRSKVLSQEFKLKPSKIMESKLVRFLLDSVLPAGQRNNYLIFSLKCLLKDNAIDFKCEEVKALQRAINSNYGGHCVFNKPDTKFTFNPNIVNKYCINNLMPPLYELWPERNKLINYNISTGQKTNEGWEYKLNSGITLDNKHSDIKLNESNNEMEDMIEIKKQMVVNGDKVFDKDSGLYMEIPWHNTDLFHKFLNGFRKKYGIKELRYYYEHVFPKFFCI